MHSSTYVNVEYGIHLKRELVCNSVFLVLPNFNLSPLNVYISRLQKA